MPPEKPPVAIRITRPYPTEDELLAKELDTITRTGVVLVGAQQRPEGVILRFELALASGAPLLRGEGRVIGYKPSVVGGEPGLAVRFTRLDSKSKALVDRVTAMREMRRSVVPPPPASAPKIPEPTTSGELPVESRASLPSLDALPPNPASSDPLPAPAPSSPEVQKPAPALPDDVLRDRDALLAKLRERAAQIAPDRLGEILEAGAARRRPG